MAEKEKVEKTFIGFLLSLRNILLTLIVNFVAGVYFYTLICDIESFYVGNGWIVAITIFMAFVWIAFYGISYITWKEKVMKSDSNK